MVKKVESPSMIDFVLTGEGAATPPTFGEVPFMVPEFCLKFGTPENCLDGFCLVIIPAWGLGPLFDQILIIAPCYS